MTTEEAKIKLDVLNSFNYQTVDISGKHTTVVLYSDIIQQMAVLKRYLLNEKLVYFDGKLLPVRNTKSLRNL